VNRLVALVASVALGMTVAAPVHAAEVTIDPVTGDTTFTAAPAEHNNLEVSFTEIDDDEDTGTPEVPVIEYHDFDAPVTTSSAGYCFASGAHFVYCSRDAALNSLSTITLGDGNDTLRKGTPGRDSISGGPGDDLLVGLAGDDVIDGGPGNDSLEDPEWSGCGNQGGSLGADTIIGGPGNDKLEQTCRSAFVTVSLDGLANDGSEGEGDSVAGDIEVIDGPGYETGMRFVGNDLPNVAYGGGLPSVLIGNGGDDKLYGGVDNDQLDGGPGNDIVEGWGGADTIDGGTGSDDLSGEGGSTITDGTGGADTIFARDGVADTVSCGSRADRAVVDHLDIVAVSGGSDTCELVERSTAVPVDDDTANDGNNGNGNAIATPSSLALVSRSAKIRKGSFALRITCNGPVTCAGTVSVKLAKRAIGSARISIPAGKTKTVRVALNRQGRKVFRRSKSAKTVATLKLKGQAATTARLTLRR
jgi:Ca2+-binding RTX toxin-like protein